MTEPPPGFWLGLIQQEGVRDMWRTITDIAYYLFDHAVAAAGFLIRKTGEYAHIAWEWFRALPFFEQLIIVNGAPRDRSRCAPRGALLYLRILVRDQ